MLQFPSVGWVEFLMKKNQPRNMLLVYISAYLHRLEWRAIPTTYSSSGPRSSSSRHFPSVDGGPCMWCFRPCDAPPSSSPRFFFVVFLAGNDYWCPSFYFLYGWHSPWLWCAQRAESPPPILAALEGTRLWQHRCGCFRCHTAPPSIEHTRNLSIDHSHTGAIE